MADAETLSKRAIERLKNRGFTSGRLEEYQPIYEYADERNSKFSNRAGWLLHGTTESAVEIKNKSLILRSAFSESAGKVLGSDAEQGISFTQFFPVAASYAESHYSDSHNKPPVIMRLDRSVMQSPSMHLTPLNHWAERVLTRSVSRSKDSFSVEFPRGSFEIFRPKGPSSSKYAEQTKKLWLTPPQELIQKVFGRLFQVAATYMVEENEPEPSLDITPGGTQFWTVFANRVRSGEINLAELTGPSARMAVKERVGDPKVASEIEYFFGSKLNAMGAVVKDIQDKIGKQNWNLALDRAKSKASQVAGNIGKFGLVFAGELLAQEVLASGASAAGFNSDAEVLDALKTKLDQATTTSGVRPHPADLSMQGSIQANPPRMRPGDLENESVLGETPATKMDRVAREFAVNSAAAGERTRRFFSAHPVLVESARSFANYVNTALSSWNRFLYTQGKMLQDSRYGLAEHALRTQLDPAYMKKALDVWNSPEAKESRFHTLDIGEHLGRMIFTAHRLAAGGFDMADTARAKEYYHSQEAGDWVNRHGAMIVDLPLSIAFDLANPAFATFTGARVAKHFDFLRSQVKRVEKAKDTYEARHILMPGAGATGIGDETSEIVLHAVRAGKQEAAVNLLHRMGYREPGPLDRLGMRSFRMSGKAYSTVEQEHILNNAVRLRRADAITKAQIEKSEPLMKFFETASSRELFQFSIIVQDEKNLHAWAHGVVNGTHAPFSKSVNDAVNVWNQVAARDMIVRKANWATESGIVTRMGRIEKKMSEFFEAQGMSPVHAKIKAKVSASGAFQKEGLPESLYHQMPPELRTYILRQLSPTDPPVLEWYWKKVWAEGVSGQAIPKWQTRLRQNQEFKSYITGLVNQPLTAQQMQLRREYFGNLISLDASGRLREVWIDQLSKLSRAAGNEQGEAAWKLIGSAIDNDVRQIHLNPAALYGGQENKDRVLSGLGDLQNLAKNAGKASEHINDPVSFLDVFSRSLRQLKLFFPFSHFITNNAVNNALKNVMARGLVRGTEDLVRPASRFSILGEDLDFMGNFLPARDIASANMSAIRIGKREIHGILDLPGLGWYNDVLNSINTPIEHWTRNFPGRAVYKEAAENIDKAARAAGKALSLEEIDKGARGIAQTFVNATQFVPYHAPMIAWWERLTSLAGDVSFAGFRAQDLALSARMAWEHPVLPTSLMRLEDTINASTVRGSGDVELGKSGLTFSVLDAVPIVNSIGILRRVNAPEIGPTMSDTALSIVKSLDAFAGEIGRAPLHFALPLKILAGQMTPGTEDMEQVTRKDAKEAMAASRSWFPGIADAVFAVTGKHLYEYYLGGEVGAMTDRIHGERLNRGGVAEQRAAWLRMKDDPNVVIPTTDQARIDFTKHNRINMGIAVGTGLPTRYDPDQARALVQQSIDWFYSLPTRAAKLEQYNKHFLSDGKTKYFEGLVSYPGERIDSGNPDKKLFDQFGKEIDPEVLKQLYHDMTPSQQKRLLQNFFNKTWGVIERIREEVRSNIGVGEAGAAEIPVPADTLISEPNIKAYIDGLPNKVDKFNAIRQVGEPQDGGKLISWFDFDKITRDNKNTNLSSDALRSQVRQMYELDFKMNNSVKAIVNMWRKAETPDEMEAIFTLPNGRPREYLPVEALNGSVVNFPLKLMFNQRPNEPVAKSRFVQTLQHAIDVGLMRSTEKDPSRTVVLYGDDVNKVREVLDFVTVHKVPVATLMRMKERQKNDALEIQPGLERMRAAAYHPDSWNPLKIDRDLATSIGSKSKDSLPADFWQRVKDAGEYALMGDYALSLFASKAAPIYPLLYVKRADGPQLSSDMVDSFLASGYEPELRLLAQSNNDLKAHLKKRGYPVEPGAVREDALQFLSDAKQFEWNDVDVEQSLGVIPRGLMVAHPPSPTDVAIEAAQQRREMALEDPIARMTNAPAFARVANERPLESLDLQSRRPTALDLPISITQPQRIDPARMLQTSMTAFNSVADLARFSFADTVRVNEVVENVEKIDRVPPGAYGRVNIFQSALHNIGQLPPEHAARGAMAVMQLGNAVGFIDTENLRILSRGISQAELAGQGSKVANTILTFAGNTTAAMTSAQRYEMLSQPTIKKGVGTNLDKSTRYEMVANENYSPTLAGINKYGGMAGSMLSMGAGFAAEAGAPIELSAGMGAAGGALQGASYGASFGPWGAGIGAVLGAALGGFMGSQRDEQEDRYAELRQLQKARLKQEIANAEERQQAFREDRASREIQSQERVLNVRRSQPQDARQQLYKFLRRPTFASSQGLVRQVEGSMARTFTPRW